MRKLLPFIAIGGAGILLLMLSRGQAAKNLKVYFRDIIIKPKGGISIPDLIARFNIVNGSNTALKIRSLVGDLSINGNILSSVQALDELLIPANGTTIINVKLETSSFNLVSTLVNLISQKRGFTAKFEGTINSQGVLIPISQSIRMF